MLKERHKSAPAFRGDDRVGALKHALRTSSHSHKPTVIGGKPGEAMDETIDPELQQELDQLQAAYKAAVDDWVAAIREEEELASGNHNVAELDEWEAAHFRADKKQRNVIYLKRLYEDAVRREFFDF